MTHEERRIHRSLSRVPSHGPLLAVCAHSYASSTTRNHRKRSGLAEPCTRGESMTRGWCFIRRMLAVCAVMLLPQIALAQEAVLSGTVTDSSGSVLPGVTVTALHTATGNNFLAVTDERGGFRVP